MSDCYNHPGREAVGACVNCGKMICSECRTILGGKIYCQSCADEVFVKGSAVQSEIKPSKGISGAWWLLPIFFVWLGGLIAWLVNKDKDPRKAKSMLFWGIGLTFLYAAIYAAIIIVMLLVGTGLSISL